jgi:branched-chain amino acid transport system substrate-binding protein
MRMKHAVVGLVAAVVAASCLTAYAATGRTNSTKIDAAKPPIHLALITFQVPGSDLLSFMKPGAQAAAKVINSKGGFGGRKLIIDSCNSMLQPAAATTCAHTTLKKKPVAEFGCELAWFASGLPVYAAAKVPSINCSNTPQDFTNAWNFGLNPSDIGQDGAAARWLCSQPNVKKVVVVKPDLTSLRANVETAMPLLQRCGKTILSPVYFPLTATDVTPYVSAALSGKPDFVIFSSIGAQVVLFMKAFQQAGFPASKVTMPDTDAPFTNIQQGGSAMDGAIVLSQFHSWGDTKDPDVAAYLKAMKGSGVDPRDGNVQWGYSDVMFVYEAAKKIGFGKFNAVTLQKYMSTQRGLHIPLSRSLFNPGPKGFPQEKQPYVQISQIKGGKVVSLPTGAKKDGWVFGFGPF